MSITVNIIDCVQQGTEGSSVITFLTEEGVEVAVDWRLAEPIFYDLSNNGGPVKVEVEPWQIQVVSKPDAPGTHIDAVLNRLISEAIDHIVAGNPHDAVVSLTAARDRAEAWGANMVPRAEGVRA